MAPIRLGSDEHRATAEHFKDELRVSLAQAEARRPQNRAERRSFPAYLVAANERQIEALKKRLAEAERIDRHLEAVERYRESLREGPAQGD
jgi:hypothetical protein